MVKGGDICPPDLAQAAKAGAQSRLTHAAGAVVCAARAGRTMRCHCCQGGGGGFASLECEARPGAWRVRPPGGQGSELWCGPTDAAALL